MRHTYRNLYIFLLLDIESVFIEAEVNNYRQGDKIEMACYTPGASSVRYYWLRNNRTITADGRIVLAQNKIIITQLLESDTGEYNCQVSNSYGTKISNSFKLLVTGEKFIYINLKEISKFIFLYTVQ